MSAEKRIQNWIMVGIVIVLAIAVPLFKTSRGEPAVKQGIDLVGGVDLLLEAQVPEGEEEVTQDMIAGAINIVRNRLDPEGVKEIIIQQMGEDRIIVQIPGEDDPERVKRMIGTTATLRFIDAGVDPIPEGTRLTYIDPETGEEVWKTAYYEEEPEVQGVEGEGAPEIQEPEEEEPATLITPEQVIINPGDILGLSMGVSEAEEGEEPARTLVIELVRSAPGGPGMEGDPGNRLGVYTSLNQGHYLALVLDDTVKSLHRITDPLTEYKIDFPPFSSDPNADLSLLGANVGSIKVVGIGEEPLPLGSKIEIWDAMSGQPPGAAPEEAEEEEEEEEPVGRMEITTDRVILTGDDFANAEVQFGTVGEPMIAFQFKPSGTEIFGRYTAQHVREYLAIALDDVIISCPVIREPILRGRGVIEGSFTQQEAQELVVKLNSGRLPVPLVIVENRTVGPTLGLKSIGDSKRAAILGAILILLFMVFYYRLPGFMADIALAFYAIVFFGALSILNATLTLPGIAGFILSVGMAVDANVIIFERLKEELKTGKTFRSATEAAFKRAFLAIFDANVTTLITALVLYNLGTGPIRGFAVTLSLGILVSMFSALVFTRLLLEGSLGYRNLQKYSLFGIREKDVALAGKGGGE